MQTHASRALGVETRQPTDPEQTSASLLLTAASDQSEGKNKRTERVFLCSAAHGNGFLSRSFASHFQPRPYCPLNHLQRI